jgi:hypothetical protein
VGAVEPGVRLATAVAGATAGLVDAERGVAAAAETNHDDLSGLMNV